MAFDGLHIRFLTGSQDLYGEETLRAVSEQARAVVAGLNAAADIPVEISHQPTALTPDGIRRACLDATADDACIGVIAWMHTFSPAKMWIAGLQALQKPFLHLHTQYGRDLPYADIDMDFMNLNQSAHGDREFAYIVSRLRHPGKVVAGHWQDPAVQRRVGAWARAAAGAHEAQPPEGRAASATTCARWRSPRATRSRCRRAWACRSTRYPVNELVDRRGPGGRCGDRAPLRRVRGGLRGRARAAAGRGAPRLAARGRAHRAGPARVPRGGWLRRLLGHLPGPRRAATAAGHRTAAPDGRWLRLRRRGRLEDRGARAHRQGHGRGAAGRHLLHGGLHVRLRRGRAAVPRRAHAGGLSDASPARCRACEIHPLFIGDREDPVRLVFTGAPGPGRRRGPVRHGQPPAPGGQRGRCRGAFA